MTTRKATFVYGSGATARLIVHFAPVVGVVDDYAGPSPRGGSPLAGLPRCHSHDMRDVFPPDNYSMLIGVGYQHGEGGMNAKREELAHLGYVLESAIFAVGFRKNIGAGCILLPGTVLHDNCVVERNCFLASNVTVGHDVQIGEHSWINSGVALDGGAVIGRRSVIGANAVIGAGVTLGERTLVGPGAVVLHDTKPGSVVLAAEGFVHKWSSATFSKLMRRAP